jgi:hypothetical protein
MVTGPDTAMRPPSASALARRPAAVTPSVAAGTPEMVSDRSDGP